jgi:hypothetical protein
MRSVFDHLAAIVRLRNDAIGHPFAEQSDRHLRPPMRRHHP